MTKAMPFLQKCDITFLRPPGLLQGAFHTKLKLSIDFLSRKNYNLCVAESR